MRFSMTKCCFLRLVGLWLAAFGLPSASGLRLRLLVSLAPIPTLLSLWFLLSSCVIILTFAPLPLALLAVFPSLIPCLLHCSFEGDTFFSFEANVSTSQDLKLVARD